MVVVVFIIFTYETVTLNSRINMCINTALHYRQGPKTHSCIHWLILSSAASDMRGDKKLNYCMLVSESRPLDKVVVV